MPVRSQISLRFIRLLFLALRLACDFRGIRVLLSTSLPDKFFNGSEDDEPHHTEHFHGLYLSFTNACLTS
jgi:hypothetical protein